MSTKLLRFYLLFSGGDWAALGSLKLSCIGLVCPYDDYMTSWWPQGRSAAAHTLPGGRAIILLDLKDMEGNITRGEPPSAPVSPRRRFFEIPKIPKIFKVLRLA